MKNTKNITFLTFIFITLITLLMPINIEASLDDGGRSGGSSSSPLHFECLYESGWPTSDLKFIYLNDRVIFETEGRNYELYEDFYLAGEINRYNFLQSVGGTSDEEMSFEPHCPTVYQKGPSCVSNLIRTVDISLDRSNVRCFTGSSIVHDEPKLNIISSEEIIREQKLRETHGTLYDYEEFTGDRREEYKECVATTPDGKYEFKITSLISSADGGYSFDYEYNANAFTFDGGDLLGNPLPQDPSELSASDVFVGNHCREIHLIEREIKITELQGVREKIVQWVPSYETLTNSETGEQSVRGDTSLEHGGPARESDLTGFSAFNRFVCDNPLFGVLRDIYSYIVVLMIVALILFGVSSFASAVASSDEDALKKAVNNFKTRVFIVVAIVLLPVILHFVIDLLLGVDSCIR